MSGKAFAVAAVAILLVAGFVCCASPPAADGPSHEGADPAERVPLVPQGDVYGPSGLDLLEALQGVTPGAYGMFVSSDDPLEDEYDAFEDDPKAAGMTKGLEIAIATLAAHGYDPFPAYVRAEGTEPVRGIAYALDEAYRSPDGLFQGTAFIAASEVCRAPAEIVPMDDQHRVARYVWTDCVTMEPLQFVAEATYHRVAVEDSVLRALDTVPLGADPASREYSVALKEACDPGAELFDYDRGVYVIAPPADGYRPLSWSPLYLNLDYSAIEDEVNRLILTQDMNYRTEDFQSVCKASLDAIVVYLSETRGSIDLFSVDELKEFSEGLSWRDVLTVGQDGCEVFSLEDPPATALERWAMGILCGVIALCAIAVVVALPGAGLGITGGVIAAIAGGALGFATETFSQVVVQGVSPSSVDWNKILVSSIVGLVTGPFLGGASGVAASAIGAGLEGAAFNLMDGGDVSSALVAGLIGAGLGAAFGTVVAGTQVAKVAVNKMASALKIGGKPMSKVGGGVARNAAAEIEIQKQGVSVPPEAPSSKAARAASDVREAFKVDKPSKIVVKNGTVTVYGEVKNHLGDSVTKFDFGYKDDGPFKAVRDWLNHGWVSMTKIVDEKGIKVIFKNPQAAKKGVDYVEHITYYPESGDAHIHVRNTAFDENVDRFDLILKSKDSKLSVSPAYSIKTVGKDGKVLYERVRNLDDLTSNISNVKLYEWVLKENIFGDSFGRFRSNPSRSREGPRKHVTAPRGGPYAIAPGPNVMSRPPAP